MIDENAVGRCCGPFAQRLLVKKGLVTTVLGFGMLVVWLVQTYNG